VKNYVLVLGIAFLLLFSPSNTFAADALYRMLHADEVEQFKEDQDAMIVGQLISNQGRNFKVMVIKVLSGEVSSDDILVADDFTYGWAEKRPSVNDFCVFSLKKTGRVYKKAWGIFEATSGDYKTLILTSLNAPPKSGLLGDLAAIQWYVNSGGTEKEFSFANSTAYVKRSSGQVVQIYPVPNKDEDINVYKDALNAAQNSLSEDETLPSNTFSYVLLGTVGLIGIGTLIVKLRK